MSDQTAEHWTHEQAETCTECQAEIKRLAIIAAAVGFAMGLGAMFAFWSSR